MDSLPGTVSPVHIHEKVSILYISIAATILKAFYSLSLGFTLPCNADEEMKAERV